MSGCHLRAWLEWISQHICYHSKKHSIEYQLKDLLTLQFKRLNITTKAHVVELDHSTQSQPETVYQTIKQNQIKGHIFIKDADSYFDTDIPTENSVCIYPLDELTQVNPQNKSYVNIDDMYYITNIIEKGFWEEIFVQVDISSKTQIYIVRYLRN